MSVCEITETSLYYRGLPCSGGLLDPLMGSVDRRHLCASCMKDARTCRDIWAHSPCVPVLPDRIRGHGAQVLRTTCFFCSRVCATADDAAQIQNLHGKHRLHALHSTLRFRKTCPHCEKTRPSYTRTSLGIRIEWPSDCPWEDEEEREYCTRHFTAWTVSF